MNKQASFKPTAKCLLSVAIAAVVVLAGSGMPVQSATETRARSVLMPAKDLTTPPAMPATLVFPADPIVAGADIGYLPAAWDVSPSGSFEYSIPIDVPDGRAGMQPRLSLNYSSSVDTQNGLLGVGWSLSGLSSITRCAKNLDVEGKVDGVDYEHDLVGDQVSDEGEGNTDRLCLDGQKLVLINGHDGVLGLAAVGSEYRTWHDTFAKIIYNGSPDYSFTVKTKDGIERRYERSPSIQRYSASAIDYETDGFVVDDWLLASETDRNGNQVLYYYTHEFVPEFDLESGQFGAYQHLPDRIEYTKHGSSAVHRRVEFKYEGRLDLDTQWHSGVRRDLIKRLASITAYWSATPLTPGSTAGKVWRYSFDYITSANSNRSLLASVQKCGVKPGGPNGGCLWKKEFDWHSEAAPLHFQIQRIAYGANDIDVSAAKYPYTNVFDADGDGNDDVLYKHNGHPTLYTSRNPQGHYQPFAYWYQVDTGNSPFFAVTHASQATPIDSDGDGSSELFLRQFAPGEPTLCQQSVIRWNKALAVFEDFNTQWTNLTCSNLPNSMFADFNGDRRIDQFYWSNNAALDEETWNLKLGLGGGFGLWQALDTDFVLPGVPSATPPVIIDFNGDGRKEVTRHPHFFTLNEADQLVKAQTLDPKQVFESWDREFLGDFNGDGLRDAVEIRPGTASSCATYIRWNTANGLGPDIESPLALADRDCDMGTARVGDVNGDGRDDLAWLSHRDTNNSAVHFLLSMGHGPFKVFPLANHNPVWVEGVFKSWPHGIANELNTNHQIGVDQNNNPIYAPFVPIVNGKDAYPTSRLGDFNGDGLVDLVGLDMTGVPSVNPELHVLTQMPTFSDRIKAVYDEKTLWPRESITYSRAWSEKPEPVLPCSFPSSCSKRKFVVVSQVNSRAHLVNPTNPAAETSARSLYYSYEDPVSDRQGRGFLGFRKVRVWDPARPAETVTTYRNRPKAIDFTDEINGRVYFPYAMRPESVTTVVALTPVSDPPPERGISMSNARVTRVTYLDKIKKLNDKKSYVDLPSVWDSREWEQVVGIDWGPIDEYLYNPSSEHLFGVVEPSASQLKRWHHGELSFDDFGNETKNLVWKGDAATKTITDVQSTYSNAPANWSIGLLLSRIVTVTEPNQAPVARRMDYDYDGLGRLKNAYVEKMQPASANALKSTTSIDYDAYGLPIKINTKSGDGLASRESNFEYDPLFPGQPNERIHVSQVWAPHSNAAYRPSSWTAIHPAYGVPMATMDVNGVKSWAGYDDLGRLVYSGSSGEAPVSVSYGARVDAFGGYNGLISEAAVQGPVIGQGQRVQVVSDGLGRSILSGSIGFDGAWIWNTSRYDVLGRMVSVSRPHQGQPNAGDTQMAYDPLDRLLKTIHPDNTERKYAHSFYETRSWDESNNENRIVSDYNDRVVQSIDMLNGAPVTTSYQYVAFGLLDTVTDDKGNKTRSLYDVLGRVWRQEDPDAGTTELSYNGLGELQKKVHLETGDKTLYFYDSLGRPTSDTGPDGTTSLTWDTRPHGIGALAASLSPDQVATLHHYDTAGRSVGFDETIDGTTYAVSLSFDAYGRVDQVQYPAVNASLAGVTSKRSYTASNYLGELGYSAPGLPYTKLWQVISRNLDGALTQAKFGNLGLDQRMYDPATGRLNALLAFSSANNKVADLAYQYYANGLVRERNDSVVGRKETYGYDALRRLSIWALDYAGARNETEYGYDTIGNLLTVKLNQSLIESNTYAEPGGGKPHALTQQKLTGGTTNYVYDKRGRQVEMGNAIRKLTYSDFDLPKTVTVNGKESKLAYNAFGERVKKDGASGTTVYIGGLYERRTTATGTEHVYHVSGPDGAAAQIVHNEQTAQKTVHYTLTDALGSVGAVVDAATGVVSSRFFFDPFGKRIEANGSLFASVVGKIKKGFTGHEHDDEFGLINMRGRMYDPQLKRMLTPDPHVTVPLFGQSWNPYSYVMNSPLNLTDPSGFDCSPAVTGGSICSSVDGLVQTHTGPGADGGAPGASDISSNGRTGVRNEIDPQLRFDPVPAEPTKVDTVAGQANASTGIGVAMKDWGAGMMDRSVKPFRESLLGYLAGGLVHGIGSAINLFAHSMDKDPENWSYYKEPTEEQAHEAIATMGLFATAIDLGGLLSKPSTPPRFNYTLGNTPHVPGEDYWDWQVRVFNKGLKENAPEIYKKAPMTVEKLKGWDADHAYYSNKFTLKYTSSEQLMSYTEYLEVVDEIPIPVRRPAPTLREQIASDLKTQ